MASDHDTDLVQAPEDVVRRFLELSLDINCIAGFNGYFEWTSPSFSRVLGWTGEELCAQPFMAFVHPDDVAATRAEFERILGDANAILFENRYRTKSGEYRWLQWNATVDGQRLICNVRDLTPHLAADRDAAVKHRWLDSIETLAGVGYWRVDISTSELFWSPQVFRIHARDPALGPPKLEDAMDYYHPDDRELVREHIERAVRDRSPFRFELRLLLESGELRWVEAAGQCQTDKTGNAIALVGAFQNVTERRKVLTALQRKNEELEQFAFVASHDMKEPIRMVWSYAERFQQRCANQLDERGHRYLTHILDGARRMDDLLRDLLEFARVGHATEPPTPVSLHEIVTQVRQDLEPLLHDSGAVVAVTQLPVVSGYSTKLHRLFLNLVQNAIKFRSQRPPMIRISGEERASDWVISVVDNGIGFKMEDADRIFLPFQRLHTRSEYEGSGIGLAVCKKIVHIHGGSLRATSSPGAGSCFSFNIPKDRVRPASSPRSAVVAPDILIVDDNPADAEYTTEILQEADDKVSVTTSTTADQVLRAVRAEPNRSPKMMLVDINLPGMNGFEFVDALFKLSTVEPKVQDLKVFVLSGSESAIDRRRAMDNPLVKDYVTKPLTPDLATEILRCIDA